MLYRLEHLTMSRCRDEEGRAPNLISCITSAITLFSHLSLVWRTAPQSQKIAQGFRISHTAAQTHLPSRSLGAPHDEARSPELAPKARLRTSSFSAPTNVIRHRGVSWRGGDARRRGHRGNARAARLRPEGLARKIGKRILPEQSTYVA